MSVSVLALVSRDFRHLCFETSDKWMKYFLIRFRFRRDIRIFLETMRCDCTLQVNT